MRENTRKMEVGEYRQDADEQADEEGAVYFLPEHFTRHKVYIFSGSVLNTMCSDPAGFKNAELLRLTRIATRTTSTQGAKSRWRKDTGALCITVEEVTSWPGYSLWKMKVLWQKT